MNNYQLYRTNLYLGGQMKWDLILTSEYNTLCVSDFHLSPISNNTPYTYKSDEYLVENQHQDNVKKYYLDNKGSFYKEFLNSEFTHNYPIICNDDEVVDCYSNIYDMGCKRSNHYNEYGKQFEFFCPLWLEHITGPIKFKIDIKNTTNDTILGSNTLSIDSTNISNEHHKKFVAYFNNYITAAGLHQGTDELISVNFNDSTASVTGLDLNSGVFKTKNIDSIIHNITYRERTLLEVDNMIIQSFKDNNLVCKQLFNFNLCFNLDDIFSKHIVKMLYGNQVKISVTVYVNDTVLELKDFYTEYNYIPKSISGDSTTYTENVLSYLRDNEYTEFIDKNKFCQSICHWSLCDNNDYIFNVYEGFSGLYIEGEKIYENEHQYGNAPDTLLTKYNKIPNTAGWLNIKNIYTWNEFYKYIRNVELYKTDGIFIGNSKYINNIKYGNIPYDETNGIYVLGLHVPSKLLAIIIDKFHYPTLGTSNIYMCKLSNLIIFLTSDINLLTFKSFFNELSKLEYSEATDTDIKNIYSLMTSVIPPSIIIFNRSLLYSTNTQLATLFNISEIEYTVNDNIFNYVLRYDGKIKPTFTSTNSTLYYKDYISGDKLKTSVYNMSNYLSYEPIYPSINYCAIKKIEDCNYTDMPEVIVSNSNTRNSIYKYSYETKWYNSNKVLVLNPEIKFTYIKLETDNKTLHQIVQAFIGEYYNIDSINTDLIEYITKLYTIENKWDYNSITDIKNYKYNITLKLKSK